MTEHEEPPPPSQGAGGEAAADANAGQSRDGAAVPSGRSRGRRRPWFVAVALVVVVGILAVVVATTVRRAARTDEPSEVAHKSDMGTHLQARDGDLKVGHNRAVNACNVLSEGVLSTTFGAPDPDLAAVHEDFTAEDVAPTLLPDSAVPLRVSHCER